MKIFKYMLHPEMVNDELVSFVKMPAHSRILTVQAQRDDVVIWAEINDSEANLATIERKFVTRMTGQSFDNGVFTYIGTFQMGPFVGHLYEVVK